MSRAVSPSVDRVYGLVRVARCWNVSRATVYRHRQAPAAPKRRPGPVGPCDDATLLQHIKQAIAESRFTGEGYRKIWARLRFASIRSSPGRVRRLMRENGLLAPHRVRKRPDKAHDGSITTEAVDVLWGTDMSRPSPWPRASPTSSSPSTTATANASASTDNHPGPVTIFRFRDEPLALF